jgi:hypothetical protein
MGEHWQYFAASMALLILYIAREWLYRRSAGDLVNDLHERGMHDAATLTRRKMLPGELPTWEQLEMMKRDGWPGPRE